MPWGDDPDGRKWLDEQLRASGAATLAVEADLSTVGAPASLFDNVERAIGNVTALVLCHVFDIEAGILDAMVENFDRGSRARAPLLHSRAFAEVRDSPIMGG